MSFLKSVLLWSALWVSSGSLYADSFDDILGYTKEEVQGIVSCESWYSNVDCFEVWEDYMVGSSISSISQKTWNIVIDPKISNHRWYLEYSDGLNSIDFSNLSKLKYRDYYDPCNFVKWILWWKIYIITANHCSKWKNLDDKEKNLIYEKKDYFAHVSDNIFINEKEFRKEVNVDLSQYQLNKVQIIWWINEVLWREFLIIWEKGEKSFLIHWSVVKAYHNKGEWYIYWFMFIHEKQHNKINNWDNMWMSGSGVYTVDGQKMVWVMSWVAKRGGIIYYTISFFTEDSIQNK